MTAHLFMDLVDSALGILRAKFSSRLTSQTKKAKWEEIGKLGHCTCAMGVAQRSGAGVKKVDPATLKGKGRIWKNGETCQLIDFATYNLKMTSPWVIYR